MRAAPAPARPTSGLDQSTVRPAPTRGTRVLERFRDERGRAREIVSRRGARGSVLVIDCDPLDTSDARLVAHLSADEPTANARIVCGSYLAAEPESRRCRALDPLDELDAPIGAVLGRGPGVLARESPEVRGPTGAYRLRGVPCAMSIPSLRWTISPPGVSSAPLVVSLREAIGALESYEPFREITRAALTRHEDDPAISTTTLRAELGRVLDSPMPRAESGRSGRTSST